MAGTLAGCGQTSATQTSPQVYTDTSAEVYESPASSYAGESAPSGTKVFDTECLTAPSNIRSDTVYYFEIPVGAGEFAIGSVNGKDGGYLLYLDISTHQGDSVITREKMVINTTQSKNDINNINNKLIKDNHDLIIKMTKNISKELVSFAINFEKIFQDAIKDEFIIKTNEINFTIKKDMEINATIIKTEPEIVQLFPYLLAFLEENIKNKEIMKLPKIQYIILYHIKAISVNKYFDLITYMNNILEILMTLLLYSNNISDIIIKDCKKSTKQKCI